MKIQKGWGDGWLQCAITCLSLSILLASLITMCGCTKKETAPEPEIPSNYTIYTDEQGLFSISYPPDWELGFDIIPDVESGIQDIITATETGVPVENVYIIFIAGIPFENGYLPFVNITVEDMPASVITHDQMVELMITESKQMEPDYHLISRTRTTVGGREATILEEEATFLQFGKSHWLQVAILVGRNAWTVFCMPPQGEYDKWEKDFQAIVSSLRILK